MKTKKYVALGVAALMTAALGLSACGQPQEPLTDEPLKGETVADFTKGASDAVFESDGWANGSVFNVVWSKENVTYGEELTLGIKEEERTVYVNDEEVTYPYTAGEARTNLHYGYGDFEVSMKPAKKAGTASTFFTCTGNYDTGLDGEPQKHDEIDIEFLGKDTTKVQFNYFVNGQGGHEHMYDLGFDASKEYHTYGYRWAETYITWFVDGKPVYRVDKDEKNPELPSDPGRILMNYWCGTKDAEGWMGKYSGPDGDKASYQWVKASAAGVDLTPDVPEEPGDTFEGDWDSVAASDLTFTASNEKYTVAKENGVTRITYSEVGGSEYINVSAPVTEAAAGKNWLHLTLKNNGETASQVRVNVIDDALANNEKNKSSNLRAYMDGEAVRTDLEWGGSFFDVPAGKTVEAEICFGGTPDSLELMIDSSRNDAATYAGDIEVSAVKFAKQGDVEDVNPDPDTPVNPDNPVSGDLTLEVGGVELTFAGNTTDGYGVTADDAQKTLSVSYTAVKGNSYKNIWANVEALARTKNEFSVKLTNNGEAPVTFRIDVESVTKHSNDHICCNDSATQDGTAVFTDKDWGGSTFTVEAGKSAVCKVVYLTAEGPTNIKLYFDSSAYDDETTHAGSVVLSEFAFTGEGSYTPSEQPDVPNPPAGDPVDLSFASTEEYTVNPSATAAKSFTVTYENVGGQTYKNIAADIATLAAGNNTVSFKIKNNGTEAVRVRVDVQGTTRVDTSAGSGDGSGTDACNVSATGGDAYTDTKWGGSFVTVAAGEEITFTITYDGEGPQGAVKALLIYLDSSRDDASNRSGNVTLSDFVFSKQEA